MALSHPKEKWFAFGDSCICVSETEPAGSARGVLVFLHGRLGCSDLWQPIVDGLKSQYRCLFVDFPGHGRSFSAQKQSSIVEFAELTRSILEQIGGPNPILVGHDIGGAVAQLCAIHWPEKVSGLVLINSACLSVALNSIPLSWPRWKMRRVFARLLQASLELPENYRRTLTGLFDDQHSGFQILHAIAGVQDSWPDEDQQIYWRQSLAKLHKPVLLLWGAKDELTPPERGFELIRCLPDASFYLNEESGHWPFIEDPEWVIGKTREFAARLNARPLQRRMAR